MSRVDGAVLSEAEVETVMLALVGLAARHPAIAFLCERIADKFAARATFEAFRLRLPLMPHGDIQ
jgi:hypothetical protein